MNISEGSTKTKFIKLFLISYIMLLACYTYRNHIIYESIDVSVNKQAVIEYGSAKYNINSLINSVEGEIVSIKQDVDTKVVGEQEVIVEIKKNNVVREIPIVVEVVDTVAPVINIDKDEVVVEYGHNFDLLSNIAEVKDTIDGKIKYQQKEIVNKDVDTNYYTIKTDSNIEEVGVHTIIVEAVDKFGNITIKDYKLKVNAPVISHREVYYNNLPENVNSNDLVSIAQSLVGSRYVAGGTTPAGFDCSGFVQYVYSQVGISVSRSANTQYYDGVAVSYEHAKPGDILSWGYSNGVVTHSALYIGNGLMIHATNPSQGVIVSDVAAWTRGSGTMVLSVRRI